LKNWVQQTNLLLNGTQAFPQPVISFPMEQLCVAIAVILVTDLDFASNRLCIAL